MEAVRVEFLPRPLTEKSHCAGALQSGIVAREADARAKFRSSRWLFYGIVRGLFLQIDVDENREVYREYRLEKKDPSANVSDPITPITFYLSPEIPELWRPYLKKGVEDWKPALEKAGFKNAIVCKDPPSRALRIPIGIRKIRVTP